MKMQQILQKYDGTGRISANDFVTGFNNHILSLPAIKTAESKLEEFRQQCLCVSIQAATCMNHGEPFHLLYSIVGKAKILPSVTVCQAQIS